jgi:putative FmdB family regulatory protein
MAVTEPDPAAHGTRNPTPGLRGKPDLLQDPPSAMPNYDYECQKCGKRFEVFQSMNDAKLTDCPQPDCDGQVKRLLGTGGGIIFKGSGFYQTDYRSSSYQAGAKADGAASAPPPAAPAPKSAE